MPGCVAGYYGALSLLILTQSEVMSVIIIHSLQIKKWLLGELGNMAHLIKPIRGRSESLNLDHLILEPVLSHWGTHKRGIERPFSGRGISFHCFLRIGPQKAESQLTLISN